MLADRGLGGAVQALDLAAPGSDTAPANGSGTGMRGVARRLGALDGTMERSSPTGGPTVVALEVSCASSSPKTTPSSGPA